MDKNPDDNFALSTVFSESYFTIPDYQRDYSWGKSHVTDLLEDIEFVYKQNKINGENVDHYFGTIVLEKRDVIEPTEYEEFVEYAIVDGQQRLVTTTIIISEIANAFQELIENPSFDGESNIDEKRRKIESRYIKYEGREKIEVNGLAKDIYTSIIHDKNIISDNEYVEAERRVMEARTVIRDRILQWKSDFRDGDSNINDYFIFLNKILKIITNRLEVNIKIVENVDEAARMFKVINNRGRGLALHDKVRSHLVYCASQSQKLESKEIFQTFNTIIRNITVHKGLSEDEVDSLVRIHWIVYTGERSPERSRKEGPNSIHRRLSDLNNYACVQRKNFEIFIEDYISSLEEFSNFYPKLTNRDIFSKHYSDRTNESSDRIALISRKIQLILMGSEKTGASSILIVGAIKFGMESEEFLQLVEELEKLIFRHNLIMTNGHNAFSSKLRSLASDLYWSNIESDYIHRIFNTKSQDYHGYSSKIIGLNDILDKIRGKRERLAPIEDVIENYLSEKDIINGEYTIGWTGVRKREVIKYIMYEYEHHLRGPPGRASLPPYHILKKEFEIEHLIPNNAKAAHQLKEHKENRNRVGNLAIINESTNKSLGNISYKEKYENIYRDSSLKILNTLSPDHDTLSEMDKRETKLFEFVNTRWGDR